MTETTLCWLRRDLRLDDNAALFHALKSGKKVLCVFIFDSTILTSLPPDDMRVDFIWQSVKQLKDQLVKLGSDLLIQHGDPRELIAAIVRQYNCSQLHTNKDYEPDAIARDQSITETLSHQHCQLIQHKDQVIFEENDILNQSGKPYTVFTPYKNAWLKKLTPFFTQSYPCYRYFDQLQPIQMPEPMPLLADLGFKESNLHKLAILPGANGADALFTDFTHRIEHYQACRDFPSVKGVSYLAPHLRFGTISIRQLVQFAWQENNEGASTWLNELIWREFYQQLLWHFPFVATQSFKPEYRHLPFENNPDRFNAWKQGLTGYPIVDAAMRQLNHTGYMHNRLRMIAASFLVKDLLIDWRWGENYFAEKLLDFDLASNNGGWQWAASTGCDAQPYFRIFNPILQSQKFDPQGKFIRRYVPELSELDNKAIHAPWLAKQLPLGFILGESYPVHIVEHSEQKQKALQLFGKSL